MHKPTFVRAIAVFPQPYPMPSYRGNVAKGKIAPPIDEATVYAAKAEAE